MRREGLPRQHGAAAQARSAQDRGGSRRGGALRCDRGNWSTARTAMAAVSARSTSGPSDTKRTNAQSAMADSSGLTHGIIGRAEGRKASSSGTTGRCTALAAD